MRKYPGDISRCKGEYCSIREHCVRYLTYRDVECDHCSYAMIPKEKQGEGCDLFWSALLYFGDRGAK